LVRDLIDAETSILIARPRRFGKTPRHNTTKGDRQTHSKTESIRMKYEESFTRNNSRYVHLFV
jgi:hypothetical protein